MTRDRISLRRALLIALLVCGGGALVAERAAAVTAADKCEAGKLDAVGKYILCRAKVEAKAVKTGDPQDYAKCDAKLGYKFPKLETTAAGQCPSNGDLAAIQGQASQCVDDLALSLSGVLGLSCAAELAVCDSDLSTCSSDLGSCLAGCPAQAAVLLRTGQTACYDLVLGEGIIVPCAGTGQDGELQKGLAQDYTDNGDGTITDNRTGLMWEKLGDDGSIHDKDNFDLVDQCVRLSRSRR